MLLLLDGYNILKKIKHPSFISDAERKNFIKKLNNYAHQKKLSLLVVFDGGPFVWPLQEKISAMTSVVYSGTRQSADDYIKNYIEQHKNNDILLISSDRELITHARRNSINSLDSHTFSQFLDSMESPQLTQKTSQEHAQKLTTASTQELDELMQRFKVAAPKQEHSEQKKKSSAESLSKEERKLLQKIKKL